MSGAVGRRAIDTTQTINRRMAYEASLFTSTKTLRNAMSDPRAELGSSFAGLRDHRVIRPGMSIRRALSAVDRWMHANYRAEVIYKNALANQILLQRHGIASASLISEFKVGESILDCIIVNGDATAYEIKTELDNPRKLHKQLADYGAAFERIYLVTHISLVAEYERMLGSTSVGLIYLDEDGILSSARSCVPDAAGLRVSTMMKALRKPEYTSIAESIADYSLDVPAFEHFRACLAIADTVPPTDYRLKFESALRARRAQEVRLIARAEFKHIRHNLLKIDPNQRQLANLSDWMSRRL